MTETNSQRKCVMCGARAIKVMIKKNEVKSLSHMEC